MNRRTFLALALLGFAIVMPLRAEPRVGGFGDVAVDDAGVVAAAKAAIDAKSKDEPVTLIKILGAQRQVVAGMNYKLQLRVKSGDAEKDAQAVVWAKLDRSHQLTSWTWK